MQVTFTKAAHRKDFPIWVAQAGKRRIEGSHLGSPSPQLPHDIVTFVVEKELEITDGFFGTVAAGGTFRSMAKKKNKPGRAVQPGATLTLEWLPCPSHPATPRRCRRR